MRVFLLSAVIGVTLTQFAAAIPLPVSSYTYGPAGKLPNGSYTDNGYYDGNTVPIPTELTDGVIASNAYPDTAWVGVLDSPDTFVEQPRLTFDLGDAYQVNSVTITYLAHAGVAVQAPDSAQVTFSYDGVLFTPIPITLTSFSNPAGPLVLSPTFSLGQPARYVRIDFFNDQQWTFLTEVAFEGAALVPEPSTLSLLGLGVVGMAIRARRRRCAR